MHSPGDEQDGSGDGRESAPVYPLSPGESDLRRTLIAAFGNPFRRDDGAGAAVANAALIQIGREPLSPLDDGLGSLGQQIDVIQLHQLVPELAETVADYDLLILIDAHVGLIEESIVEQRILPSFQPHLIAHQTRPSSVLALSHMMVGRAPEGVLLSLRGHDFGFGEGLSPKTAALVPQAVSRILQMIQKTTAEAETDAAGRQRGLASAPKAVIPY